MKICIFNVNAVIMCMGGGGWCWWCWGCDVGVSEIFEVERRTSEGINRIVT